RLRQLEPDAVLREQRIRDGFPGWDHIVASVPVTAKTIWSPCSRCRDLPRAGARARRGVDESIAPPAVDASRAVSSAVGARPPGPCARRRWAFGDQDRSEKGGLCRV